MLLVTVYDWKMGLEYDVLIVGVALVVVVLVGQVDGPEIGIGLVVLISLDF